MCVTHVPQLCYFQVVYCDQARHSRARHVLPLDFGGEKRDSLAIYCHFEL